MTHPIAQQYAGFTLAEREQNQYHDSYFHLTVWDADEARPVSHQYAATAYPSTPMHHDTIRALLEATLPSVRNAHEAYKAREVRKYATLVLLLRMEGPDGAFKGDTIAVARGRKVPKGTTGKVIGVEERRAYMHSHDEKWVTIATDSGAFVSIKAEYCNVLARGSVAQDLFDYSC